MAKHCATDSMHCSTTGNYIRVLRQFPIIQVITGKLPVKYLGVGSENDIINSTLKEDHQVFTDLTLHAGCLLKIVAEGLLKHTVDELGLLLLTKLAAVLAHLAVGSL